VVRDQTTDQLIRPGDIAQIARAIELMHPRYDEVWRIADIVKPSRRRQGRPVVAYEVSHRLAFPADTLAMRPTARDRLGQQKARKILGPSDLIHMGRLRTSLDSDQARYLLLSLLGRVDGRGVTTNECGESLCNLRPDIAHPHHRAAVAIDGVLERGKVLPDVEAGVFQCERETVVVPLAAVSPACWSLSMGHPVRSMSSQLLT